MSTTRNVLDENGAGVVHVRGNELCVDSKISDAAAIRIGSEYAPGRSGGGGLVGFDVLEGSRKCIVLFTGGQDQNGGGELTIHVLKRDGQSVDADMLKAIEIREGEIQFRFPISAPNLVGGQATGNRQRLESANGKFVYQLQDDPASGPFGAIIVYDTHGNIANEAGWTPVAALRPTKL